MDSGLSLGLQRLRVMKFACTAPRREMADPVAQGFELQCYSG